MKKYRLFSLAALLFATACTQNDPVVEPEATPAGMHFYGVALPETTRGAAQHDRLWHNGTTIKVKFLNGSTAMREMVEEYAHEWEQFANITFRFVENEDAHVRVGFDWNANRWVTWSYIGTDCKVVRDQAEATMSFADFDYKTPEVIRGDVLRAFGQALGLELESRNVNFVPQWSSNVNRVASYWEFDIEDVTWDVLKKYVFDPLDADNAVSTDQYDELSIMRWPFPSNILLNGGAAVSGPNGNLELSDLDKEFVASLYPKPSEEPYLARFVIDHPSWSYGEFGVDRDNAVFVDWGDGTVEAVSMSNYLYHEYNNGNAEEYTITLRGDADALYAISTVVGGVVIDYYDSFDFSGCTHLRELHTDYCNASSLDVSNCPLLETLSCSDNQLTSLDVSNNPMINYIHCSDNPFTSDQAAMVAFANSLPDRTGMQDSGHIYVSRSSAPVNIDWISDICAAKNWTVQ